MIEEGFYISTNGAVDLHGLRGFEMMYQTSVNTIITFYFKSSTIKINDSISYTDLGRIKLELEAFMKSQRRDKKRSEIEYLRQKVESYQDEVSNVKYQLNAFVQMFKQSTDNQH